MDDIHESGQDVCKAMGIITAILQSVARGLDYGNKPFLP